MFVYLLRNLKHFVIALRRPGLQPLETARLRLRVRITDLDYNLHMNNARYLESLEIGRFDQMTRMGLAQAAFREGLTPVVTTVQVIYRASLKPFQSYEVRTRVAGWDDKFFYVEQDIVCPNRMYTSALVKAAFLKNGKTLPPQQILERINLSSLSSPPLSTYMVTLTEGLAQQYTDMKAREEVRRHKATSTTSGETSATSPSSGGAP